MPPIGFPFPPVTPAMPTRLPMFRSLGISASGLGAQRARMDVIATNIANAEVTRTPDGGPYRRQVVELRTSTDPLFTRALDEASAIVPAEVADVARVSRVAGDARPNAEFGVAIEGIATDMSEGPRVYEPGHPDADADGYVTYPNVRITDEIVDLMDARRQFEANATVFQVAKAMLRRSLEI